MKLVSARISSEVALEMHDLNINNYHNKLFISAIITSRFKPVTQEAFVLLSTQIKFCALPLVLGSIISSCNIVSSIFI